MHEQLKQMLHYRNVVPFISANLWMGEKAESIIPVLDTYWSIMIYLLIVIAQI